MATIPLPGYEKTSSPCADALFRASISSLVRPRKTPADAGRSALCLLFTKQFHRRSADRYQEINFVTLLQDELDKHLHASTTDLVRGIEAKPLHGLIAAIR